MKNEIENIQITTPISLYLSRIVILTTSTSTSTSSSTSSSNSDVIYKTKKLKLAISLHTRQVSLLQQAVSLFMPLGNLL